MLRRACGTNVHSPAGNRQKVQEIMARSGPAKKYKRLWHATNLVVKHAVAGHIDHSDALLILVDTGVTVGMPTETAELLFGARLEVELAQKSAVV